MSFSAEIRLVAGRESFGVELAKLLFFINSVGSLREAANAADLPYSTAWRLLARAERALGVRLVESARRRDTALTEEGRRLLRMFLTEAGRRGVFLRIGRLVYAGSHDLALEESLPSDVEVYFLGSLRGLLAVASSDADWGSPPRRQRRSGEDVRPTPGPSDQIQEGGGRCLQREEVDLAALKRLA